MSTQNINIEKYDFDSYEVEQKPFTMILNSVIQTTTNHEATFMWIYLQSMPPGWKPNKQHLMKHFKISDSTYGRRMAWLNSSRLIEYRQERNEHGKFTKSKLIILDGIKFISNASFNRNVKIDGMDFHRTVKIPLCGENTPTANEEHINTIKEIKEIKEHINIHEQTFSSEEDKPNPIKTIEPEETSYLDESPKFQEFWNLYPVKKQQNKCKVAWYSQNCDAKADEIIAKLKLQKQKDADFLSSFAPNPFNYLTQERWNDELKIKNNNKSEPMNAEKDEERLKRYAMERDQQKKRMLGEYTEKPTRANAPVRLADLIK